MSTTFTTLEINPEIMREIYPQVFTSAKYDAAALIDLKQTVAKDKFKWDCFRIFRIDPSESADLSDLDLIVDKYVESFQRALMYLQCYYYFTDCDDVEGINGHRKRESLTNYKEELSNFQTYYTDNRTTSIMGFVGRG